MSFLVPYNSQIIKSRISRFAVLSWPCHLSILLTFSNPFTSQVQTIHKINQILVILLLMLAKTFFSNIVIDLLYHLSNYLQFEMFENCLKWFLYIDTLIWRYYHLGSNEKLLKYLGILKAVVYLKDQNWISKTVYCISCLVVCTIVFCSEFPDIPNNDGRRIISRKTQEIAKRFTFHANATSLLWIDLACKIEVPNVILEKSSWFSK